MRISINQKAWGQYYIFKDGDESYLLFGNSGNSIWSGAYADVYDTSKAKVLSIKQGKMTFPWNLNRATYFIEFTKEKRIIEIKCVNYLKGHWTFKMDMDEYHLHLSSRGGKIVFKEKNQIAKYTRAENGVLIIADDDENILLLTGLFITFNMSEASPDSDIALDILD